MGADVHLVGPRTLLQPELASMGVSIHYNLDEALEGADVVNVLRIQKERQGVGFFPGTGEYTSLYGINRKRLEQAKKDVLVLHPGPMNRGLEIEPDVCYWEQSSIQEQVKNGVCVRMAVLYLTIIGGDESGIVVKHGRLINPVTGEDKICDIRIDDTKITAIGTDVDMQDADILDATGLVVTPGLIDMHVHLRQPGQSAKETIESGTKAAAAGGFTRVATMPNTKPVIDSAIIVDGLKYKIAAEGVVKVDIIGSLSKGLEGKELSSMGGMAKAGVVAFSDDGRYVQKLRFYEKSHGIRGHVR